MATSISLTTRVPCTAGFFGSKLTTYQTQVKATDIIGLLGHDPRSKFWSRLPDDLREMYQFLQRKTNKERKLGTRRYIETRFGPNSRSLGAFPAIAIGTIKPAKFEPYAEKFPNIGMPEGVGDLLFDLSASHHRVLLDGLSRVTGALDLIDDGELGVVENFAFPVTIFCPSPQHGDVTVQELGQLFHDFNFLAAPIPTGQAIDLDQTNIYIQLTSRLGQSSVIKSNGGMEARAKSLGKKSTALVAKQVLLRFVKGSTEGEAFLHTLRDMPENEVSANLTDDSYDYLTGRLEWFLEQLSERMGPERFKNRESMHLAAPGWNALGVIFNDIEFKLKNRLAPATESDILDRIAAIDWSRYNKDWFNQSAPGFVDLGEAALDEKGVPCLGKAHGGQQAISKMIEYVRQKSGVAAQLAAAEQQQKLAA
jgi:DNA-sulfur modification-associated